MYTLQGKARSTHHTLFMLDLHRVTDPKSHVVRVGNLSLVPTRTKQALHPGEILAIENRLTRPSFWVTLFSLPHDSLGVGGERFQPSGYTATSAYWAHITSMRSIRSILAHSYQPLGP
jgi:hypothetical protein